MISFFKPGPTALNKFLEQERVLDFSYPGIGATRRADVPSGFDRDFAETELGTGEAVWTAARQAIDNWAMFPEGWTFISPAQTPVRAGSVLVMAARVLGIWWLNSCRIVYVIDEPDRYGFAYGTLPGHVEKGEELFWVARDAQGLVRYGIQAFSRPRHWMVRIAYPLARIFQAKFRRDSLAAMRLVCATQYTPFEK